MDGASGRVGPVSSVNSLVGNQIGDDVGTVTVLGGSGNYLVGVPHWGSGTHFDLGAAAWGNARTGVAGPISSANALVGTDDGDQIGQTITAVGNGNAVIDNHTSVTLMRGTSGLAGGVSAADTIHAPDIWVRAQSTTTRRTTVSSSAGTAAIPSPCSRPISCSRTASIERLRNLTAST